MFEHPHDRVGGDGSTGRGRGHADAWEGEVPRHPEPLQGSTVPGESVLARNHAGTVRAEASSEEPLMGERRPDLFYAAVGAAPGTRDVPLHGVPQRLFRRVEMLEGLTSNAELSWDPQYCPWWKP